MNARKRALFLILIGAFLLPCFASALKAETEKKQRLRPFLSLGGRAVYYRSRDADHGNLAEGAQARFRFTDRWSLESSVDFRQDELDGVQVDVIPLQLSVMVHLMPPDYKIAPYILAGGGWYYTHIGSPVYDSELRFGPHAGGGVEFFTESSWSFDCSFRYLWTQDIHSQNLAHPLGRNLIYRRNSTSVSW